MFELQFVLVAAIKWTTDGGISKFSSLLAVS